MATLVDINCTQRNCGPQGFIGLGAFFLEESLDLSFSFPPRSGILGRSSLLAICNAIPHSVGCFSRTFFKLSNSSFISSGVQVSVYSISELICETSKIQKNIFFSHLTVFLGDRSYMMKIEQCQVNCRLGAVEMPITT